MICFKELEGKLDIFYEGDGNDIAQRFYIPILKESTRYERLSGFFSADSLTVIAAGIVGLIRNNGRMRLVLGAHDLGPELREAYILSKERAQELINEIGNRIAESLERAEDIIARRRLEALAWMLASGTLEIRVAIPKKTYLGLGNGIFHEKLLLFSDKDGCRIAAAGSANETRAAYEVNGENLTLHMDWKKGHSEYIDRYIERFESIWDNRHPDYFVFQLPDAIEKKLREKYYPERPPEIDPLEDPSIRVKVRLPAVEECVRLVPAARLVRELGNLRELAHLGLGPVRLFPHQVYTIDFVLSRFPYRALLADEVGLGKTLEAGGIIKRLVDSGKVKRVLILAPKNVARQWLDEMWNHFGLRFWLLETAPKRFIDPRGMVEDLGGGNPFDEKDFMVASWHYARGSRRRESELLTSSKFFDLVVIDEAHAARKKRQLNKIEPTRLHELCMAINTMSPHILMVTATPVQLYAVEAHDLLRILGLGGPWVHESDFDQYYRILSSDIGSITGDQWAFAFRLAAWIGKNYLADDELERLLEKIFDKGTAWRIKQAIQGGRGQVQLAAELSERDPRTLKELLLALSPIQWFMVRNTRERLKEAGYKFPERVIREEPVELDPKHRELIKRLDDYLRKEYARYEKMVSRENRAVIGFVRSIYHQRFVSSFTASYLTIKNRKEFLEALLRKDTETLLHVGEKLLEDEDWEGDEEDLLEAMEELLEKGEAWIKRELEHVRTLEDELRNYSPEILSGADPKLRKIVEVLDDLIMRGHRVLTFSKYTDTVDAVVRFVTRESRTLTKPEIGIYTGSGGCLYDKHTNSYKAVGKEDVRKALDEGLIKVLVCSDAASEGLNLQSASAIINVDMPWNPAKVEQRIGRSDRLGQKAPRVTVVNVWYPDSIEAEMYRVLFERKHLYHLVVGPAQGIVSEAMQRALEGGATGEYLRKIVDDTVRKIEEVKEEFAKTAGVLRGTSWEGRREEEKIIEQVKTFALKAAQALGIGASIEDGKFTIKEWPPKFPEELERWNGAALEVGRPNALTPAHPIVRWIADSIISMVGHKAPPSEKSVYVIKDFEGLGEVVTIKKGGAPERCSGTDIIRLLDEFLGGR